VNRVEFIKTSFTLGAGYSLLGCLNEQTITGSSESSWNSGDVAHILPTVNHNTFSVSTSYIRPVKQPILKVGKQVFTGRKRDSQGFFWAFHCEGLSPSTTYELRIFEGEEPLCDLWPLKTFPSPSQSPEHLKLMVFTCAGGHPLIQKILPIPEDEKETPEHFAEKRIKLLHRGLSLRPDAMVVIGDSVYWDLSGNGKGRLGTDLNPYALEIAGKFDKSLPILGTQNEEVLKRAVSPQIIDLYGTACRSTPVFFFNDDHDYFENDEANDQLVTFPPKPFQLELGRTVQAMYYPEFLPDANRPVDLPGSNASDREANSSEAFGTLRYGNLVELLMYDCRRFVTLSGATAQFIPSSAEKWLINRTLSQDVKHTIHLPSTPYGWSAGKWLEWYPDVLGQDQMLHDDLPKFFYQKGWHHQHNRLIRSMYDAKHKKPIIINGDIHTFASGTIYKNGKLDLSVNPIYSCIAGTLGTTVFPSTFRKTKASLPNSIDMEEDFENIEENGFSIIDIDSTNIQVSMYKYLWSRDDLDIIPSLQPFQSIVA